jgi:amidophosphoribosyltransferase
VRLKLNTVRSEFEGRNVLLVDDSIVRGTTSNELVQMAREAGANKVFFCSASPEIRWPNVYGVDLPSRDELIAHGRNLDQIAKEIGADWVLFQALDDMLDSVRRLNPAELDKFEDSTFSGHYITDDVDAHYFDRLSKNRSNDVKKLGSDSLAPSSSACSVASKPEYETDSRPPESRAASPTSRHANLSPSRVASPSPSHIL